ncbi:hypothetical protein GGI03_003927 [Coemansia sp. RSA 2337]|nr:hypothetical protein H4S04_008271 [Coemansia sp. S16]KAJ2463300.1 hypothetical protein GGI03_003927 [Coemansia sp. RSA 2337]
MFMDRIDCKPKFDTIQDLDIGELSLSIHSLCLLIKCMPRMTQLKFEGIKLYGEYVAPNVQVLYNKITKHMNGVKSNLQFCQVTQYDQSDSAKGLSICALILATVCPRFTRLVVCNKIRSEYDTFIRQAIAKEPFSKHAARLSRLMFNELESSGQIR